MTLQLVTIGPSHYCEKARWALQLAGLPFEERRHPPLFHVFVAKACGGGRTTPVLLTGEQVLADSSDILAYVQERVPAAPLYPQDPQLREEVLAWEERCDDRFGPHARRFVYGFLLDDPTLVPVMNDGVRRGWERLAFRAAVPGVRFAMRKAMGITPAGVERSRARIAEELDAVGARLAEGRRYLVGERFTAADLTFAALCAPLVFPPEYGFPLPPLSEGPPAYAREVEAFRAHPAGAFCLRIYREERARRPGDPGQPAADPAAAPAASS